MHAENSARRRRHLSEKLSNSGFKKVDRRGEPGQAPLSETWVRTNYLGTTTTLFMNDFSSAARKNILEWLPRVNTDTSITQIGNGKGTYIKVERSDLDRT